MLSQVLLKCHLLEPVLPDVPIISSSSGTSFPYFALFLFLGDCHVCVCVCVCVCMYVSLCVLALLLSSYGASLDSQLVKNLPAVQETWV